LRRYTTVPGKLPNAIKWGDEKVVANGVTSYPATAGAVPAVADELEERWEDEVITGKSGSASGAPGAQAWIDAWKAGGGAPDAKTLAGA
jgi:hypothetical protein